MNRPVSSRRLSGKRVVVLGAGRSGLAAARLLAAAGADLFASDLRPAEELAGALAELDRLGVACETGGHSLRGFPAPDFAVASPGVPASAPVIRALSERGAPVFSEIELASWFCEAEIVAVTGSNAKTTVARWIEHVLREAGRDAVACGNVGYPFSDMVRERPRAQVAVVEISSYQLELIDSFRPHVSVLTNISPDHLDRHGDLDSYARAKARIWLNQREHDWAVLPADDELVASISAGIRPRTAQFSLDRCPAPGAGLSGDTIRLAVAGEAEHVTDAGALPLPGRHNVANALCAALACRLLGVPLADIRRGLASFAGVPHRLELVADNGRVWLNDSKATNVDSLRVALASVPGPIVLIAGGRDKGAPYDPLRALVNEKVARLLLIGEGAARLRDELGDLAPAENLGTLDAAIERAHAIAQPGDTVLLSPGCASFDQFADFEQRGDRYRERVRALVRDDDNNHPSHIRGGFSD